MAPQVLRRVATNAGTRCPRTRGQWTRVQRCGAWFSSSSVADDEIVVRLVSVNDVYNLSHLPKLATFVRSLDESIPASAVTLNGE